MFRHDMHMASIQTTIKQPLYLPIVYGLLCGLMLGCLLAEMFLGMFLWPAVHAAEGSSSSAILLFILQLAMCGSCAEGAA